MDYEYCPISPNDPTSGPPSLWLRAARRWPWLRRRSGRVGLQVKLVISFMAILAIALSVSAWTFVRQSNASLVDVMGGQARDLSYVLSLASRAPLENKQWPALRRMGDGLLKSPNVLYVAFFDAQRNAVVVASSDDRFESTRKNDAEESFGELMQVQARESNLFGDYFEISAPIFSLSESDLHSASFEPGKAGLIGYVSIGMSHARDQEQLQATKLLVLSIGGLIGLLVLPIISMLVHRIFLPIREFVVATDRIARGELDVSVAIHRPDVIGTLARSFNEMVIRVKQEQDALEDKVQIRTAELERANTRLSREIAEKEDFLRAVSHDLNAPLRNISGMTSMLMLKHSQTFDADIMHRLERIQKNVEVETDLIGELLELSRIKTRRHKMEAVDLHALVEDLRGMFEPDLSGRQIELIVENHLPTVHGERARLRQVFQNLIDNAIKYMGEGTPRRITLGSHATPGGHEFYISDTGVGIDPDDIGIVFFIFRRGKNKAVQNIAGKGVGLASVKSILETYGGTISVESKPGAGTTFRFRIGRVVATVDETVQPRAA